MNICVDCRHHHSKHDGGPGGPGPNVWFHHICLHPELSRAPSTNPVTGVACFWVKNDLGRMVATDDQYPYCRDINSEGDCEFWDKVDSVSRETGVR